MSRAAVLHRTRAQGRLTASPGTSHPSGEAGEAIFLRLRVLAHRVRLDKELAEGASTIGNVLLSLRAGQLQSMRLRRSLASGLTRHVELAERYPAHKSAALPTSRGEVIRAQPLLLQLVARLREPGEVSPRGVAIVKRMLTDGASPMFSPGWRTATTAPGALEREARVALAVFDGREIGPPPCDPQR